jgi:hypothetical protein
MTHTRREFFKFTAGAMSFMVFKPDISFIPTNPIPPATTTLGQELVRPLLKEGLHTVKILDINIKESPVTGEPQLWFSFETIFGEKTILTQVVSPRAPWEIIKLANKANAPIVHDSVDLTAIIGRQIDVEVKHVEYNKRTLMQVKQ